MATLFGKSFTKQELMKRIGDISQVADAKQYELKTGMGKGLHCIDLNAGDGFRFTVVPDRGMDIAWAEYKGLPFGFISKTGLVSTSHYDPQDGFAQSFFGGLLTTCGMANIGPACVDQGQNLELHGRFNHIAADDVAVLRGWEQDEYRIKVRGVLRESAMFGENMVLTREISCRLGETKIRIRDTVENCGFEPQPLMLLYHCNFGFPLLSEDTVLVGLNGETRPRDAEAEIDAELCRSFHAPIHGYKEKVYLYEPACDANGEVCACLWNRGLNIGAYVKYNSQTLPCFTEWKQTGEGDYVVGLEPGTYYPLSRTHARENGKLLVLQPGDGKAFELEIGVTTAIDRC